MAKWEINISIKSMQCTYSTALMSFISHLSVLESMPGGRTVVSMMLQHAIKGTCRKELPSGRGSVNQALYIV